MFESQSLCNGSEQIPWIQGKHLLITGASNGIGRQIALRLYGVCSRLTLVSRNRSQRLDTVAQELEELSSQLPSRALPTEVAKEVLDVRDRDRASALMARIYDAENGQVDAFLNCAGGCHSSSICQKLRGLNL